VQNQPMMLARLIGRFRAADNAAMSETQQKPPRVPPNRFGTWAIVGAVLILSSLAKSIMASRQ
jgi:hypothetical protein